MSSLQPNYLSSNDSYAPKKFGGWLCAAPGFIVGVSISLWTQKNVIHQSVSAAARYGDNNNHHIVEALAYMLKRH